MSSEEAVIRAPRFWIGLVAIVAIAGILFVLITPAPDELPSTGPHALDKTFALVSTYFRSPSLETLGGGLQLQSLLTTGLNRGNLLALTCVLLC
jgi:hypothetical protein